MSYNEFPLQLIDYIIFITTLAVSTLIGLYFGCLGNRQSTVKEYLLGGKRMRVIPIAVSVAVSHFSGTALVGVPADVYRYGTSIWLFVCAFVVMGVVAVFVYLPVFFKLQLTSTYEYLEKRFDQKTKILGLVFYILADILMFPILIYAPSLTFATMSGFNVQGTAVVLCAICIFYTSLGGLKTVVWTDFLQFFIIMTSLAVIYITGLNQSGGFIQVWNTAYTGERLQTFNFGFDFTSRDNFWAYSLGCGATFTATVVVHQTGVQKFLALPKYSDFVWTVVYVIISFSCVHTFCVLIGLETYALYKDCDPLSSKQIQKHEQLVPFSLTVLTANLPGVSGLLVAAICSASLSTMSSNLNALAAVIYKEVVCLFLKEEQSEARATFILKIIVVLVGILGTCLIFVVERLGEIISIMSLVFGIAQGPLLGLFTLGMVVPRANSKGAFFGTIGGFVSILCLAVPSKYYQMKGLIKSPTKPLSTSGCSYNQALWSNVSSISQAIPVEPHVIFKTSFFFYSLFGAIMTVIFGLVISYVTTADPPVDENLLSPVCRFRKLEREAEGTYLSVEEALQTLEK
ncbi:sodium-coupled monocarboxylate transporter 1-like isoform X1 [Zophobas morio]|uniref:sodium-coupled monocarboxylate transporter 1-like isoform X1 n=1 Tax=Zophobas morio TaxID=2755281 RepID=UPI003083A50C